jgi:hypothetical protein
MNVQATLCATIVLIQLFQGLITQYDLYKVLMPCNPSLVVISAALRPDVAIRVQCIDIASE